MGKLFKTGWERKPRDKDGNLLPEASHNAETRADDTATIQTVVRKEPAGEEVKTDTNVDAAAAKEAESVLDPITGKEKAAL